MTEGRIRSEPFIDFIRWRLDMIECEYDEASRRLAFQLGWDGSRQSMDRVRRYYAGRHSGEPVKSVARTLAEDAIDRAGYRFVDWYPEFVEDVELEPEQLCWGCRDLVTPIHGRCPWSERAGHLGYMVRRAA